MVVDIIPCDNLVLPLIPKKKQSFLSSFFGKKSPNGTNKATSKRSAVGAVEELFEEGSAMLDKRYSHRSMYISAINNIFHLDFLLFVSYFFSRFPIISLPLESRVRGYILFILLILHLGVSFQLIFSELPSRLGKNFPPNQSSGVFRCAVCQADQPPADNASANSGSFATATKPWEGPFLCPTCQKKKDAMEGKRAGKPAVAAAWTICLVKYN